METMLTNDVKHFSVERSVNAVVKVNESDSNVLDFPKGWIVADSKPMRDGSIQDVATMNISKYKTNPVLLKDHEWSVDGILATDVTLKKEDDGTLRIYSARFGSHQTAQEVKNKILERLVRDTSTGLVVGKFEENENGNLVYKNSELVEISVVMIGNNYAARLNQLKNNEMEPEIIIPTDEKTPVVETTATPAPEVKKEITEEMVNVLTNRINKLEADLNEPFKALPTNETKSTNMEEKMSSAAIFHGQLKAIQTHDRSKLKELNDITIAKHEKRFAGLGESAMRNALDFGTTALVPQPELLAEVKKPSRNFGVLVPFVQLRESILKQSVTYTVSPGFVNFADDANFCADAPALDPTYTLRTLTFVRKSGATVICRDLDTVSPVALEADVTSQLRDGALREHDEVIIAALLAIGSPVTVTIDETSATTLFTTLGAMPGGIPASYVGNGENMAYITTWGNFQWMKAQAQLLANPSLAMELANGTLNGFPVRVIANGLLPSYIGTTTADDNWIIFGDLSGVTLGRWENIFELDVRTDGTVAGVNLTASNSVALIGRMHIGATVDFTNFVFAR